MEVKILNNSNNPNPTYATEGSAGMDLRAWLPEPIVINPGERALIPTGIHISLPQGCEARIQPRSGLALKQGITCNNAPGCVDSDYRGDIGVILINHGKEPFKVENGDRIAQMIISKYERVEWLNADTLDETERGDGGFGHTGAR